MRGVRRYPNNGVGRRKYVVNTFLSGVHRIVRGVNNLGIETACDWAVPKEM